MVTPAELTLWMTTLIVIFLRIYFDKIKQKKQLWDFSHFYNIFFTEKFYFFPQKVQNSANPMQDWIVKSYVIIFHILLIFTREIADLHQILSLAAKELKGLTY
jgi:hypothetical protein